MSASTLLSSAISESQESQRTLRFLTRAVVGLVNRPGQVSGLIAALANSEIEHQSIEIVRGHDAEQAQPGLIDRLVEFLSCIGHERCLAQHYRVQLAAGATLVIVRDIPDATHAAVAQAMKAAGGRFTIRTLAP